MDTGNEINRKLLYIGYYVDEDTFENAIKEGNSDLSRARQNFEKRLLNEIQNILPHKNLLIASYFPITGHFRKEESYINNNPVDVFAFSQSLSDCFAAYNAFRKYLIDLKIQNCNILFYSLHPVLALACLSLKRKLNLTIITICSELPQFRASGNRISFKRKIKNKLQGILNKKVDKYILFSESMKKIIPVRNKPYVVVEGITPELDILPRQYKENIVMYAGGMGKQNNIPILVEACIKSSMVKELWICGDGEDSEYVKNKAGNKIKYLGNLTNEEVLLIEQKAKILVNLRDPRIQITKYAFPSKILEYLAAGVIVISTRLEGIQKEYFDYLVPIDNISVDSVAKTIDSILMLDKEEYTNKCESGRNWVLNNKSAKIQAGKIITFIFTT